MIGISIEREDIKLSLYTNYLIICFENPKVTTTITVVRVQQGLKNKQTRNS